MSVSYLDRFLPAVKSVMQYDQGTNEILETVFVHTPMQTAAMLRVLQMKQLTGPRPSRFGQEHDSMCTSFLTAKSIVVSASARWRGRLGVGGPNLGDLEREYLRFNVWLGWLDVCSCSDAMLLCVQVAWLDVRWGPPCPMLFPLCTP